jgi:hypothetical protein
MSARQSAAVDINGMKMKPATPLPWHPMKVGGRQDYAADPQDARYIAHACNAYPKLVAELRTAQECCPVHGQEIIEDLLRELGEK